MLFIGAGDTTVAALKIASNLKSATLEADVEVIDSVSTLGFIFHVSLEWSATGKAETENFKELFNDGTTRITSFTHTKQGEAIAQGSVELNGYNYTPEASTEGTIGREKDRTLIIEKLR